ncbi:unnamed protein product, partial [Tetraodon nigroviridis]
RHFLKSPNFDGWFRTRRREMTQKLEALHLEALCEEVRRCRGFQGGPGRPLGQRCERPVSVCRTCSRGSRSIRRLRRRSSTCRCARGRWRGCGSTRRPSSSACPRTCRASSTSRPRPEPRLRPVEAPPTRPL